MVENKKLFKVHTLNNSSLKFKGGYRHVKPGTHVATNHASCLAAGDARTTSNIFTCEQRLC